jgi:ABC-2 type transport system permease protein
VFTGVLKSELEAREALEHGDVQFVITIPTDFSRDLLRGDKPKLLVEADATDPAATSNAINAACARCSPPRCKTTSKARLAHLAPVDLPAMDVRIHALYNPEAVTQYNIVPGLMGVVLTMTMVMITALAITRERERGTMENLLSMPTRPFEVLLGKIVPYILVGYIQVVLILIAAHFLFHVPMVGNLGCCSSSPSSSSPRISPSASPSPRSRRTSSRPCRARSFSSCPRCCSPVSCSRFAACRDGRRPSARSCRSRI